MTPSIVQREEYGFMTGKVESVSLFPISREALISWLKNEKLVDSIMAQGPVLSDCGDARQGLIDQERLPLVVE